MTLKERIEEDLKTAMRARDELARETLRMVLADLKNRRIELGQDLAEADELAVLGKAVKSRQESVAQYTDAGREDLATKERSEVEILQRYLPRQLTEDETRTIVQEVISELGVSGKKDIGQVMKTVMSRFRGEIDGKLVQRLAGELLSSPG